MSPDPMVPVKVGVIGIGNMGWHHARVLSLCLLYTSDAADD